MSYQLYHAGVKGMKWGVRNDKTKSSNTLRKTTNITTSTNGTITKTKTRKNTISITSRNRNQKAKLMIKRNRGAKIVAKNEHTNVKVMVSNTANVAAGAMRVAAAFVPGLDVLNSVAIAANLVGTVSAIKK